MNKDAIYIHFIIEIPNDIHFEIKKFLKKLSKLKFNLDLVEIKDFF